MKLNPPPQIIPQSWAASFIIALVESVRLLFEAVRVKYQAGITAGAVQTQDGATQLTGTINNVGTVGTASDGVRLPPALKDEIVEILNTGANALQVWPASANTVDGGAANAVDSNTLAAGSSRRYFSVDDTDYITLSG